MAEAKADEKVALRAVLLDGAEQWITLNALIEKLELKGKAEGKARNLVAELLSDQELEPQREDDEASPIRRSRHNIVSARLRALGLATKKEGSTRAALREEGVTKRDVDELVRRGLLEEKGDDGEQLSLSLNADDEIWREGARVFVVRSLPIANVEEEGPLGAVLVALAEIGEWATWDSIQEHLTKDGDSGDYLAQGPLEELLTAGFNRGLIDLDGGEPKRWREGAAAATTRRAAILEHLLLAQGSTFTKAEIAAAVGAPLPVIEQDLAALDEAEFLEESEEGIVALSQVDEQPHALRFSARHSVEGLVSSSTKEVAVWREKHASEKRRANDLAQWLRQHGVEERDVLDTVRGVVRAPKARSDEFSFAQARPVNQEERGVILGEIIALEGEIAQEELARDGAITAYKGRIKALNAQIQDLKNAAACNSRVVEIRAYRRTDWEDGKVYVHAVDDDRVLSEEPLPKGAQRTIPGTQEAKPDGDKQPATTEAIEKFAADIAKNGVKVSTKEKANGQTSVKVEDAPAPDAQASAAPEGEPGPLASEETRKEAAKRPRKKGPAKQAEASS